MVFFFSSRRRHTRSVSAFLLNRSPICLFVFRLLRLKRFSTFSVKVLNLFSRSRRKTNKRKSKHSAMLRSEERRVGKEGRERRVTGHGDSKDERNSGQASKNNRVAGGMTQQ